MKYGAREKSARFDLERLRAAWPISAELARRGHSLRGRRGRCPSHGDEKSNSTSFAVSADGQSFYCHSKCGGGSVFTLAMLLDGVDFRTAVKTVACAAGFAPRRLAPRAVEDRHRAAITARRRNLIRWRNRRLLELVDILRETDENIEWIGTMLKRHPIDAWPGPSLMDQLADAHRARELAEWHVELLESDDEAEWATLWLAERRAAEKADVTG